MLRLAITLAALAACACATTPILPPACRLSGADQSWADRALGAWRFTSRNVTGIGAVSGFQAVLFDAGCAVTSGDALNVDDGREASWIASVHSGTVPLPGREGVPAGVTSFTLADDEGAVLVMSTPSVWRAGGVRNEELGLETMMVAVLLHEGSHVSQARTYGRRVSALAERFGLPESFNDDSLQARFEDDEAFAASVARETDLFHEAAAAADLGTARRRAGEARESMRSRARKFYTGADAYWAEAEDLWLTFEGAGQWAAYQWVIHPRGANVAPEVAIPHFARRSRWWSQNQGLALFLALDRIAPGSWKRHAYGDGARTALEMLDAALGVDAGPSSGRASRW